METIIEKIENKLGGDYIGNTDWRLGFLAAFYFQQWLMEQENFQMDQLKSIDPWHYESTAQQIYEMLDERSLVAEIDVDDFIEAFVECWNKVKQADPLAAAFGRAKSELKGLDQSTAKARSEAVDAVIRRTCEIISKETKIFYIPTRKLGKLIGKSRNYAALKLGKLCDEGFLIEVEKGTSYKSPRFKINTEEIPF